VRVKYYNRNSAKWRTEDISNYVCQRAPAKNQTTQCTVGGKDDLADANNDDITQIKLIYYRIEGLTFPGGYQRSGEIESKIFTPKSPKCQEKKVYGTGQKWRIE